MVKGESFRMFEGYFGQGLVRREHSRARAVAAAVAAFFREGRICLELLCVGLSQPAVPLRVGAS